MTEPSDENREEPGEGPVPASAGITDRVRETLATGEAHYWSRSRGAQLRVVVEGILDGIKARTDAVDLTVHLTKSVQSQRCAHGSNYIRCAIKQPVFTIL